MLWPSVARITWFPTTRRQVFFLPEWQPEIDTEEHAAFLRLATEAHGFFNFVRNFQVVRARLAERGIPYYWGLLDAMPTEVLEPYTGLDGYVGAWKPVDLARDGRHGGINSHAAFAAAMLEAIERNRFGETETRFPAPRSPAVAPPPGPGPSAATADFRIYALPRPVRRMITSSRLRRRIRTMKRRDPFIY